MEGATRRKATVLVHAADPKRKPLLFACPTCGTCHSVKQHGRKEARALAVNCSTCRPKQYRCDTCSCKTPRYWTRCDGCRHAAKLEAAVEIDDDGGPYSAFNGDTYYHELEEARDAGLEWVSPCHVTYPKIDADNVLENLLDDMHEDASVDDMDAVEPFYEAVKAFNAAQTIQSWFGDDKRKINVAKALALPQRTPPMSDLLNLADRVEINPCPFCAGKAVMRQDDDPGYPFYVTFDHAENCVMFAVPTDMFRSYATEVEAARAWNGQLCISERTDDLVYGWVAKGRNVYFGEGYPVPQRRFLLDEDNCVAVLVAVTPAAASLRAIHARGCADGEEGRG